MIEINSYRVRIGLFDLRKYKYGVSFRRNGFPKSRFGFSWTYRLTSLFTLLLVLIHSRRDVEEDIKFYEEIILTRSSACGLKQARLESSFRLGQNDSCGYQFLGFKINANFWARYTYGNKVNPRGIKNFHLNIRSLSNKIAEVKYVIKQESPQLLGLSECELHKPFDEKKFTNSWL